MKKLYFVLSALFLLLTAVGTFWLYSFLLNIRSESPLPASFPSVERKPTIYIGVVSRYSPYLIYEGYQPIMDYLSAHTGHRYELRLSSRYEQTIKQLANGEVAAAFLGSFLYARYKNTYRLKALLQPLNAAGQPLFRSVVITAADQPLQSINQIKGKRLALPSPLSFSGNWLFNPRLCSPVFRRTDFDSIRYFGHHNTVVYQIIKHNFDVGVVKERVAREFLPHGIKMIARSKPFPSSPLVVSRHTPPAIAEEIRKTLLPLPPIESQTSATLTHWDREFRFGFVPAREAAFDSLAISMQGLGAK